MRDWWRVGFALIGLNLRKSWFRLRGAKGRAPCQSASDSGRARETRCEACASYDRAARFRLVCPDLVRTDAGWRCGRAAAEVRPYWGRAVGATAVGVVGLWLVGTTAAWGGLRIAGLEGLRWEDIFWPPGWGRLDQVRRAHFMKQASAALGRGDVAVAQLALQSAAEEEGGWREGVAAARLGYFAGYIGFADQGFETLMARTPAHADEIAINWHDAMLAVGYHEGLARLAMEEIPKHAGTAGEPWWRAYLAAIAHRGVAARLAAKKDLPPWPTGAAEALAVRRALDEGDASGPELIRKFDAVNATVSGGMFAAEAWLDLGRGAEAFGELERISGRAGELIAGGLDYAIRYRSMGEERTRGAFRAWVDAGPVDARRAQFLLAALVRHPSAANLSYLNFRMPEAVRKNPGVAADLWVAARLAGQEVLANEAANVLAQAGQGWPPQLTRADLRDERAGPMTPRAHVAALLPIGREMLYALRAESDGAYAGRGISAAKD